MHLGCVAAWWPVGAVGGSEREEGIVFTWLCWRASDPSQSSSKPTGPGFGCQPRISARLVVCVAVRPLLVRLCLPGWSCGCQPRTAREVQPLQLQGFSQAGCVSGLLRPCLGSIALWVNRQPGMEVFPACQRREGQVTHTGRVACLCEAFTPGY